MAKGKSKPAEPKRQAWQDLNSRLGRRDWNGLNPTIRVIPNKKRSKEMRKNKHKGRNGDPFFVAA